MGLKRNTIDQNVYYHQSQTLILILIPYADDIYLTGSDIVGVAHLMQEPAHRELRHDWLGVTPEIPQGLSLANC